MVYDFIGGAGENAEGPGEVNDGGSFSDFVHVKDGGAETAAGAFGIGEGVSGAGGFEAVLDMVWGTKLMAGSGKKGPPSFTVG